MKNIATIPLLFLPFSGIGQTYVPSPIFGNNGAVRQDVIIGADGANAHALLPDGKLLLVGDGYDININSFHVSLMRIDTVCGTLDTTFGVGGKIAQTHLQRTQCWDIAVQPDGKIVGCGMIAPSNSGSQQMAGVFRFNADGSVDSTFNGTGYHQALWDVTSSGRLWRPFVNADGSITCAGTSMGNINGGSYAMGAMRFTSTGAFDPSFNGDGIVTVPIVVNSSGTGAMRPDGRLLVVGNTWSNEVAMAQFNTDGTLDTTFGSGGMIITPVITTTGIPGGFGASLLPDGRILVSGPVSTGSNGFLMARFLADGTLDSTYATNGISAVTLVATSPGYDHELLADGSTLQYGISNGVGTVLKRDADGQVVATFGTNGFVFATTGGSNEEFLGGFTLHSGRIVGYGGATGTHMLALKLTTDPIADALPSIAIDGTELVTAGSGTFQWYLDGNLLLGETGNTITPLQNGVYTVTMTISSDCVYTSDPFNMLSVGIGATEANDMHLLNNPVLDLLVVMNPGARTPYALLGLRGTWLGSGLLMNGRNEIDLSGSASGIYLLRTPELVGDHEQRVVKL